MTIYDDTVVPILELLRIAAIVIGSFCLVVTVFRFRSLMRTPDLKKRMATLSWTGLLVTIVEGNFETLLLSDEDNSLVGPRTMLSFVAVLWSFMAITLTDGNVDVDEANLPWWERGRRRASHWLQLKLTRQGNGPRP